MGRPTIATIFTHALVPIAVGMASNKQAFSARLLGVAAAAAILPDADVIAFSFDIPYADPFGHRGFTHSIAFAVFMGLLASLFAAPLHASRLACFALVAFATVSHPMLDALTNGGLGVAFFWPITDARYFLPWRPIAVSPIGIQSFFTSYGLTVLLSEVFWVVLPLIGMITGVRFFRTKRAKKDPPP